MNKKIISVISLVLAAAMLCACGSTSSGSTGKSVKQEMQSDSLYVRKVDNLPDDFILGVDMSSLIAEEQSGVTYYDFDGEEQDVLLTLAECGVTHIRVRVWNDPYDENGNGYGGGNNDIEKAVEIGKRATAYGMKLIVDFHYSDFWADPGKQMVPLAWADMDIEEKTEAVYEYTADSLKKLLDAGVDVGIVQIGNETNGALCGETKWFDIQYLMQAGAKAVREVYPEALVALHFANPENAESYATYASKLDYYNVDYDIFATSYYPYWHGTLENLAAVLSDISETYGKKVMVMETSYAYTSEDSDFSGNTISDGSGVTKNYPFTVQGQANCFRDIVDTIVNKTTGGIGVVYWEGAWISVGGSSWEENSALWEKYGSGWASSYAAVYDPDDAGQYYGGSAVDNQTFFDPDGKPLESLKIFGLMKNGNEIEVHADAIEDTTLIEDVNGEITLPETVNAVMNDDSRTEVPVEWEENNDIYSGEVGIYDVKGTAQGLEAHCWLSLVEYNYLENWSFETGDLTGWSLTERGSADELFVENKQTDSLTGSNHMHFWSAAQNSVDFSLEQTVTDLPAGTYKYSISVMGGDAGDTDIYAYVKVNGEDAGTCPMKITSYGNWDTALIENIEVPEGAEVTVGISVKCSGAGNGAWGKIDDAMLNSVA